MLTVAATLKHQQRNVVDYVTQVCEAALWAGPAPTLPDAGVAEDLCTGGVIPWRVTKNE